MIEFSYPTGRVERVVGVSRNSIEVVRPIPQEVNRHPRPRPRHDGHFLRLCIGRWLGMRVAMGEEGSLVGRSMVVPWTLQDLFALPELTGPPIGRLVGRPSMWNARRALLSAGSLLAVSLVAFDVLCNRLYQRAARESILTLRYRFSSGMSWRFGYGPRL